MNKADGKDRADPALEIVSGILNVVPVSRWTFAHVDPNGELKSLFGSTPATDGIAGLTAELKRQRGKVPIGPRIAATLGPLHEFASGITLVFADAHSNYGILTLLRDDQLGSFTSSEISMLAFALDAVSDHLSALRFMPPRIPRTLDSVGVAEPSLRTEAPDGAFYVLDADLEIVLAWTDDEERRVALTGLKTRLAQRLPVILEETVRALTSAWSESAVNSPGVARPVSFLVVRTQPMSGPTGLFIGVHIDRYNPRNSLTGAAARYRISPREIQVLALLFDGNHLEQIAKHLFITSSTVQDHIKSMLDKTESRNRSELIARVLGWGIKPLL